MQAQELRSEIPGFAPIIFADVTYAKPKLDWLLGKYWNWFQAQRQAIGLKSWTRRNDCDNFARAYAQSAQDCHALSTGNDDEGLAVGEFYYHSPAGPHAIIIAFTDVGKIYIEPQTGKTILLTPQQELSCFFVRF